MDKNEIFRKSNLERISSPEKMNNYIKVVNPSVVIMLIALGLVLLGGLTWGFFGNIPQTESMEGAFYSSSQGSKCDSVTAIVSADAAGKLKVGMDVQVSPNGADRESYGYLKGTVESISQYPTSVQELEKLLGNTQLAETLLENGRGQLMTVNMEKNDESVSGMKWSSNKGNDVEVSVGTMAMVQVVVKNQRPIELILE